VLLAALLVEIVACRSIIGFEDGHTIEGADAAIDGSRTDVAADGSVVSTDAESTDAGATDGVSPPPPPFVCTIDASAPSRSASCKNLGTTCGESRDDNCCASAFIDGGTYTEVIGSRSTSATVSAFALDKYEVTVGRFRSFVDSYVPNMTPACAGKNPNDPNDPGWQAEFDLQMPKNRDELKKSVGSTLSTWTDNQGGPDTENRPVDYVTWWEALAFCIWDGGRLPTLAEWQWAASGSDGTPRTYPWGEEAPGLDAGRAIYGCFYGPSAADCTGMNKTAPVGVPRAGDTKTGLANMAGNVAEWVLDWRISEDNPLGPCVNCANFMPDGFGRAMGGGDFSSGPYDIRTTSVSSAYPYAPTDYVGFRCARNP
jgi:formylglycine-generating enzyme required for sulfatase activity